MHTQTTSPTKTSPKILHVITGLNDGGAEAVLYRLCTYDTSSRHHVVSLMDEGKYGPMLKKQGVTVTCLGMPRGRITPGGLWKLWRLMRTLRPDVVQTWMYHADLIGGLLARSAGIRKTFWNIRNSTLDPQHSARSAILVAKACAILSHWIPANIICCSQKALHVHRDLGYFENKMKLVPNGYDLSLFRPDLQARESLRTDLGINQEDPVVGFVARFDPQKDHANLLRALGLLREQGRDPVCLLVGTGLESSNDLLTRLIADLGLQERVLLLGRRSDIPTVMNALDIHIMSSAYGEAFPNALAEAMACGTPCITTDVGDAAVIVGDTGWVIPPRNPEALATAISQALTEWKSPKWSGRKRDARHRIENAFTIDTMTAGYHAVWSLDCAAGINPLLPHSTQQLKRV